VSEHVILIGACGWQYPVWDETFYPEGLPGEWQLGYYGNEYRVVLIPAAYWHNPALDVEQWLEETDQSPGFLSEWPQDTVAQQRAVAGMALLGARAIGFVIELKALPDKSELAIYKELLKTRQLVFDLTLSPVEQRESILEMLNEILGEGSFGRVWHGDIASADVLQTGPLALTRIRQVRDVKELRGIIEASLAACRDNRRVILIVDGDPPDIQLLQNAGIILDLL